MRQTQQNVSPMSNEGRNAYVVEHLTDTLLTLLQSKPINDISITDLCDSAGVGRASFYRNYESKEKILSDYISQLFHAWMDEYDKSGSKPLNELIRAMFTHLEAHSNFFGLLSDRGLIYLLKDVVIGIYGPKPEHSKIESYTTAFFAYSLYGWIEVWFSRGMQETADEISDMFKINGL